MYLIYKGKILADFHIKFAPFDQKSYCERRRGSIASAAAIAVWEAGALGIWPFGHGPISKSLSIAELERHPVGGRGDALGLRTGDPRGRPQWALQFSVDSSEQWTCWTSKR
jgi:hypothetical protein